MNLLFLHPTPGLGRQHTYYEAAKRLHLEYGHKVVMAYNGPPSEEIGNDIAVVNFNEWSRVNSDRIHKTSLIELEGRYPKSNLWLGVVSERRVSNYSLLDGSYPTVKYTYNELLFLLKAIVLFYEELLVSHEIKAVLAHHPDNIHSTIIFEMCRSLPIITFLLFPDYYWNPRTNYFFDSKYFTSRRLLNCYQKNMEKYEDRVVPFEHVIQEYICERVRDDPAEKRNDVLPRLTMVKNFMNSIKVFKRKDIRIYLRKPNIVDGYGHVHLMTSVKAWMRRNINLIGNRFSSIFVTKLPSEPFVYFPLQRVPEAAMLVRATSYLNQQGIAQAISASLPSGYKLVIKDHPRNSGIHPVKFYKKLLELPNVVILDPRFLNSKILEQASLLITIGGTLGYQQLMRGKPIVMFGRKFYECLEGVIRINDLNDLPYILKKLLVFREIPDAERMKKSLYSYIAALHTLKYEAIGNESIHKDPDILAELIATMLEKDVKWLIRERMEVSSGTGK